VTITTLRAVVAAVLVAAGGLVAVGQWQRSTTLNAEAARLAAAPTCANPSPGCRYTAPARVVQQWRSCGKTCTHHYTLQDEATSRSETVVGELCPCGAVRGTVVEATWWAGEPVGFTFEGKTTPTDKDPGRQAGDSILFALFALWGGFGLAGLTWVVLSLRVPLATPSTDLPFTVGAGAATFVALTYPALLLALLAVLRPGPGWPPVVILVAVGVIGVAGVVFWFTRVEVTVEGIRNRRRLLEWSHLRSVDYIRYSRSSRVELVGDSETLRINGGLSRNGLLRLLLAVRQNAPAAEITAAAWRAVGPMRDKVPFPRAAT